MVIDPIGDMLVRIKNAGRVNHKVVTLPFSSTKLRIANILSREGFVGQVNKKVRKGAPILEIEVLFGSDKSPKVKDVTRISKPSRRMYAKKDDLQKVKSGYGVAIVSTPRGIMTGSAARKAGVGGEVLFEIW